MNRNQNIIIEEKLALAVKLLDQNRLREVEEVCQEILTLAPGHADALQVLGVVKTLLKDFDAAINYFRQSLKDAPGQPTVWVKLGHALNQVRKFSAAHEAFETALSYDPGQAEAAFWLGVAALGVGDEKNARSYLEASISANPEYSQSYEALLRVPGFEPDEAFLSALKQNAASRLGPPDNSIYAHYALAAHYRKKGQDDKFASHVEAANRLQRQTSWKGADYNASLLSATRAAFNPALLEGAAGKEARQVTPIFIVGLPRSGSSMVEQILSCHNKVVAGDELYFLHTHLISEVEKKTGAIYPEGLDDISQKDWQDCSRVYQEQLLKLAPDSEFITDKLFSNALYVGSIRMAMPWAKVVYVQRNLMDTALSIYSNYFGKALSYACDLKKLARYVRLNHDIMKFWKTLDPSFIHEVAYEDLVGDLESEARKLLEFCGLEWQPKCLDFHTSRRRVMTLSVAQVHRPLYSSSIGNWKKYTGLLAPFKTEIQDLINPSEDLRD